MSTSRLKPFLPVLFIVGLIIVGALVVVATNHKTFSTSQASASKLDMDIANAEKVVAAKPPITKPYIRLAELYLQKVRETSDATYYTKIDALMNQAATIDKKDADVPAVRASVAMGRHNFKEGKAFIQQALALNTHTAAYYGLNGDADIELGMYKDAADSFQKMVDIRPDFASWSRIAYLRELYGDIPGAQTALTEAISSGSSYPENIAWAYVEQGKLRMRTDLAGANESFTAALRVLPTYSQAMEGLGKSAYFKGDMATAEKEFSAAYATLPLAQYAVDLGDLYVHQGDNVKSSQQYALAQAAFATSAKAGVNTDLEESLFLSDHGLALPQALEMARRAYQDRPSEYGADYLSWALYKNGNTKEAATYQAQALTLGEIDPLILFHQGVIAHANGDAAHAREYVTKANQYNPHFSMQYADELAAQIKALP